LNKVLFAFLQASEWLERAALRLLCKVQSWSAEISEGREHLVVELEPVGVQTFATGSPTRDEARVT
jgi:hypothetical protein